MEPLNVSRSRFILDAARTIGAKLSTDEVLQRLMNLTRQYFKPDAVSVASIEPDGSIVFRAASGEQADQGLHGGSGSGSAGTARRTGLEGGRSGEPDRPVGLRSLSGAGIGSDRGGLARTRARDARGTEAARGRATHDGPDLQVSA